MKCPNCGAETSGAFCSFCGSELPKEGVHIVNNYYGNVNNSSSSKNESGNKGYVSGAVCPKCGSNKITFNRESAGTRGLHKTVGLCKDCGNTWVTSQDVRVSSKNKGVAMVLCVTLGYFGAHHFYVGRTGMGILYLLTMGLFCIGWIVDIINIANGKFKDVNGNPLM